MSRQKPMLIDTGQLLITCAHMSTEEFGAYMLLVMTAWENDGNLPDDPKRLAKIAKLTPRKWARWSQRAIWPHTNVHEAIKMGIDRFVVVHRDPISPSLRQQIFERDGRQCVYCGSNAGPFHLDHVHPFSRGGRSVAENLVVACEPCNLAKRDRTLREWQQ
jgi:hypothetical protein